MSVRELEPAHKEWIPISRAPLKLDGYGRKLTGRGLSWLISSSLPESFGQIQVDSFRIVGVRVHFGRSTLILADYSGNLSLSVDSAPPDHSKLDGNIWDFEELLK